MPICRRETNRMRQIDPRIYEILKTETLFERALRTCPEARRKYRAEPEIGSGNPEPYSTLKDPVSIGRAIRYVAWPPHRNYLIEISYLISGTCRMTVGGREIVLKPGDFFIPNQYTILTREALGEDDILVSFVVKPQFVEDLCAKLRPGSLMSEFFLGTLRKEIAWNRYLHFPGRDDIAVTDLAEVMLRESFPYLNDSILNRGAPSEPEMLSTLLTAMLLFLARDLDTLAESAPANYDALIRQKVRRYISSEYKSGSLKELAAEVNQSESALSRQIKSLFGCNFKELLLNKRFERAVMLLEQTDLSVGGIAEAVGYENTSFFYRRFRSIYGISPKEYRVRLAKEIPGSGRKEWS